MVELLAPAGDFEGMEGAISAGADAVYAGGMAFGARAYARNFDREAMLEAIEQVKSGQVTYAVRDTKIDDKEIHEGDIMGIGDAGIIAVGTQIEETTRQMLDQLVDEDSELISLYYGEEVKEEEAQRFVAEIEEKYPDVDVDAHYGGQPIYYYVLAVE